MTFARIQPVGWSLNQRLESSEMNQLDIDHANSLDKTGDIVESAAINFESGGVLQFNPGSVLAINAGSAVNVNSDINILGAKILVTGNGGGNDGIEFPNGAGCILAIGTGNSATFLGTTSINGTYIINGTGTQSAGSLSLSNATMSGTTRLKVASRPITRVVNNPFSTTYTTKIIDKNEFVPIEATDIDVYIPHFTTNGTLGNPTQKETDAGQVPAIFYELDLPHNAVLNEVHVMVDPPGSHAGMPSNKPSIRLHTINVTNNGGSFVPGLDATANLAAYEVPHEISITGQSITIDRTVNRYVLKVFGETGTNALPGMNIYGAWTVCTITEYDEG
jgi:hypothetical protein